MRPNSSLQPAIEPKSHRLLPLVSKAVLAPSSHNTQPWRFRLADSNIELFADRGRRLPVNDPDDRELTISCGCALMNLRLAAAQQRLRVQVELLPDPSAPDLLARMSVAQKPGALFAEAALAECIDLRRTYRKRFSDRAVEPPSLDGFARAAAAEGAWLRPLDKEARKQIAALVSEGDGVQWANPEWRRELAAWLQPRRRGEGLPIPRAVSPVTHFVVRHFDMGGRQANKDRQLAETAPALAVLGTDGDTPHDWLRAGQALERVLLTACRYGMQASYLNQAVQVAEVRSKLQSLVGGGFPQIVLRVGYPPEKTPAAARRPLDDVVEIQ